MGHVLINELEFKSDSPTHKNLDKNDCECIEEFFTTTDEDIPDICYQIYTNAL